MQQGVYGLDVAIANTTSDILSADFAHTVDVFPRLDEMMRTDADLHPLMGRHEPNGTQALRLFTTTPRSG